MLKKNITYVDYNGVERNEDHYFNLSKVEINRWEYQVPGGMTAAIKQMMTAQDNGGILNALEDVISRAYGVKSADGKRLIKSPEISEEFMQTEAYNVLFDELTKDDTTIMEFINAIIPQQK